MAWRAIFVIVVGMLQTGCATLVNGERQTVYFKGGLEQGTTKVQTPDGTFDIENGSGSYLLTRSKSDIPLKVTCPDGTTKAAVAATRFDWGWGGAGNILNYGLGWLVDPFMSDAYIIEDITLMGLCKSGPAAPVAH